MDKYNILMKDIIYEICTNKMQTLIDLYRKCYSCNTRWSLITTKNIEVFVTMFLKQYCARSYCSVVKGFFFGVFLFLSVFLKGLLVYEVSVVLYSILSKYSVIPIIIYL